MGFWLTLGIIADMNDYTRIARIIRYIVDNQPRQPSLAELARMAGLSESHFHRLFLRWAGVTPKDFLQCLTLEHAKERLRASESVLTAALAAGLSGPGRLHDLQVSLEASSPGEYKSGGAGMTVEWGYAETPFGLSSIGWNARGICHMAFHEERTRHIPWELRTNWPKAAFRRDDEAARKQMDKVFHDTPRGKKTLKAFVRATPFQFKVWRALLRLPEGTLVTYGKLACVVGNPGAARAVGTACAANPIAFLIPCHRVIRETGAIKGYAWGMERKHAVLAWEAANASRRGQEMIQDAI